MFIKSILPGLSWAIFILLLCSLPSQNIGEVNFWDLLNPDKIVHSIVFMLLALFLIIGFKKQHKYALLRCNAYLIAILLAIIYGVVIEWMQISYFQSRSGDLLDAIANAFGAIIAYPLFKFIYGNTIIKTS